MGSDIFMGTTITKQSFCSAVSNFCDIGCVTDVSETEQGVNTSAIIQTETGEKYFVKCNTFAPSYDVFYSQPFTLSFLSEENFSFPTPNIVGYDYSHNPIQSEWFMTEYISGETADISTGDITTTQAEMVGEILGEINSVSVQGCGVPQTFTGDAERFENASEYPYESCSVPSTISFSEESWSTHIKSQMYEFIRTSDSRFTDLKKDIHDFIETTDVREVSPHLTHFDFWWENIIWDSFDTKPYIIDWERTVGGDPVANMRISEHFMFDTVAIESTQSLDVPFEEQRSTLREAFRDGYKSSYTGSECLSLDSETNSLYKMFVYARELRGFPYWWRNKSLEWKQSREVALRSGINKLL